MAEFVGDHSFEFPIIHELEDSLSERNGGVVRIAACRKGIRRWLRRDVELGHRNTHTLREPTDQRSDAGINLRCGFLRQRLCAAAGKRNFVGEKVAGEVHHDCDG